MSETQKDVALGLFVLAIAIGGFLFVNPTDAPVTEGPGGLSWRTMPFVYSGLLLLLALLFIAITLVKGPIPASSDPGESRELERESADERATEAGERPFAGWRVATWRRVATVVLLVAYSQALGPFGFAATTPLFLFALFTVFGKTGWLQNLLVSVIGGLVLWLLFASLLKMPLRGSLWDPLSGLLRGLGI